MLEMAVLTGIALLLGITWYAEAFVVPTSSMAPGLCGVHANVHCDQCGLEFACGLDGARDLSQRVICPNCGHFDQPLQGDLQTNGDRLLVHRTAFAFRPPRRWEVIAYRSPVHAQHLIAKRVVGLPGEAIQIRDGDVYANGVLQRKTLAEQRALAIPVYDADHTPSPTTKQPERWRPEQRNSHWTFADGAFTCHAGEGAAGNDWLVYHHYRRRPEVIDRLVEAPVVDEYGYNQTQPTLLLYPVRDLLLNCQVRIGKARPDGRLLVRGSDGAVLFVATFDIARHTAELTVDGRVAYQTSASLFLENRSFELTASTVDQQVLIAIDGVPVMTSPIVRSASVQAPTSQPWALGVSGLNVQVTHLRVDRDVYYTPMSTRWPSAGLDEPYPLGPDEFFVLGDNSPRSIDSRYASTGPGVPANLLVGKPFLVHYPSRRTQVGGVSFQVPDFARIGYIR